MVKKTETEPEKMNLYQRILECSKQLTGLKKTTAPGVHGEFWSSEKICVAVRAAMNTTGIIHNFDIQKTDMQKIVMTDDKGQSEKLLISVEIVFTYINVDIPEEQMAEVISFKDIQTVKQLNLNSIISKAKKTHYVGKFNISTDEDAETPEFTKGQPQQKQQSGNPAAYQNFGPEWVFTFTEYKGTKLKDVPVHGLLELLNSSKTIDKLKVAIRFFLKSKGIATDGNNEVHK